MSETEVRRAVERLVERVSHWPAPRWVVPGIGSAGESRGDLVYALVQRLADRTADAEGQPRRTVPRLGDLTLPDQLRVIAADLQTAVAAGGPITAAAGEPPTAADGLLAAARADIDRIRRAL